MTSVDWLHFCLSPTLVAVFLASGQWLGTPERPDQEWTDATRKSKDSICSRGEPCWANYLPALQTQRLRVCIGEPRYSRPC